jgi:large subunit ribosomal protein L10
MAMMLTRLGIEPMELQLRLVAAYSDGDVMTQDSFAIDLGSLFSQVLLGYQYAINLSVNTGIPTTDTISLILAKAHIEAKGLALKIGFFSPDLLKEFLAKANSEAFAIAAVVSEKDPEAIPSEILGQVKAAAATVTEAAPAKDSAPADEPDDKDEGDEAVAGLGGLFG